MKISIILLLLVISLFCLVNKSNCRSGGRKVSQDFDQDEFSEFDNIGDEDQKNVRPPTKQQVKQPEIKLNDKNDDDDATIEQQDDFTSFEEDVPSSSPASSSSKQQNQQVPKQQNSFNLNNPDDLDMEEFEHFVDEEEFEGFETSTKSNNNNNNINKPASTGKQPSKSEMPSLKIADVPMHLMSNGNWQNYVYEIVMLVVIGIYLINFLYGKSKNYRLVTAWYNSHREILERNFSVVGDDGNSPDLPVAKPSESTSSETGPLIKDSENCYALWCTGRQQCDGLLIQLKLIKRQDLINGLIMQLIKPQSDQLILSVEYTSNDDIDNFVFCLTNKKISQQMFNDYQDLSSYCLEKKALPSSNGTGSGSSFGSGDYSLNSSVSSKYVLLNEIGEIPNAVLDTRVCAFLNKYPDMVESIHISDQYVGYKVQVTDESTASTSSNTTSNDASPSSLTTTTSQQSSMGLPKSRCMLVLCLNIPGKGLNTTSEDMEKMQPAFQLAMHLIDKVPRIRLSKEAKMKAIKKRKDVAEQFMKLTHKQRQEAAMLRKEEKRRAEKEKIMNESDPEKQKRLEEKEIKREKRKNLSKMKQVKIKSM